MLSVDLGTGDRVVVSSSQAGSQARGEGPPLSRLSGLTQADATTLLASDSQNHAILSIDVNSGARTLVSGGTGSSARGTGPELRAPTSIGVAADGQSLIVFDSDLPALVAVNRASGARTIISGSDGVGGSYGTGSLRYGSRAVLDPTHNRALVTTFTSVLAVDLASGAVSLFGPEVLDPWTGSFTGLAVNADATRVYGIGGNSVSYLDLGSGGRAILSWLGLGAGTDQWSPIGIAVDEVTGRARTASNSFAESIFDIDTSSGARRVQQIFAVTDPTRPRVFAHESGGSRRWGYVSANGAVLVADANGTATTLGDNSGASLTGPRGAAFDSAHNRLLVTASGSPQAIIAVDLGTGARTALGTTGLNSPAAIVVDAQSDLAYVADGARLASVSLTSSRVTILDITGTTLTEPTALALDEDAQHLLVADSTLDAIVSVALSTGESSVVSGRERGAGFELALPSAMARDRDRLLVVDSALQAIVAVDLSSGDREILSRYAVPPTP